MLLQTLIIGISLLAAPSPQEPPKPSPVPIEEMDLPMLRTLVISMRDALADQKRRMDRLEKENEALRFEMRQRTDAMTARINEAVQSLKEARSRAEDAAAKSGAVPLPALSDGRQVILRKHLETVGDRLNNKPVRISGASFLETDSDMLDRIPGVELSSNGLISTVNKTEMDRWIRIACEDSDGGYLMFVFAEKARYADTLLNLPKGAKLNIDGFVVDLVGTNDYGVIVSAIEIVKPTADKKR